MDKPRPRPALRSYMNCDVLHTMDILDKSVMT